MNRVTLAGEQRRTGAESDPGTGTNPGTTTGTAKGPAPADPVARGVRAWRWSDTARRWTAGAATFGLAVTAGLLTAHDLTHTQAAGSLLAAALVLAALGALASRTDHRPLAIPLSATGGALAVLAAWAGADAWNWTGTERLAAVAGAVALTLLPLGPAVPGAGRDGVIGAAAVVALGAVWEAVLALEGGGHTDAQRAKAGAVAAVVSVLALGLLPRLALAAAGLTGLDDQRAAGARVGRHQVRTALAATHHGLVLATVVAAASATGGGLLAAAHPSLSGALLTVVLAAVLLSRARAYPLVTEVVALCAAAAVLLVRLVLTWAHAIDGRPYAPLAVLAVAALLPVAALAVRPPAHLRARLRRSVDLLEAVGVLALFPLAVGVFGLWSRLAHAL
ncbi:type VII secretion integral membrane protein EccD [Streptomyces sp. HPF1205]|uniref:type VII secretion integral membrane protein EccD n=1 Tax=Streptomyces sp. HPF1205 TaxID=2873262 RepID=UPI001CED41D4|nr:type VII secretion integral membrane protein EccD [Streptomyces sp. HPF1205]